MLKFLKSLLGSGPDQKTVSLTLDAVPAYINEREKSAQEILHTETKEPMRAIQNAMAGLQLTVNNLEGAEEDPETHPKIKSIAKNSLPLFLKAMNTSLAKELPEDPGEFYTTAVESVKGALNAVRGQGRYLQVAFPDEMKETKAGIDAVGREINTMTKALGRYRGTAAQIAAARAAHAALEDAQRDLDHSVKKEERHRTRLLEISARLSEIGQENAKLSADPSLASVAAEREKSAALAKEREECHAALCVTLHDPFARLQEGGEDRGKKTSLKRSACPPGCNGDPLRP